MILKSAITVLIIFYTISVYGFQIGSNSVTYQDPDRSNRNIPVDIYYPANQSGQQVSVADGQFPVVVFGHGFAMVVDAYQNIWEALVPLGYIVVLPKTEGGTIFPPPNHQSFGLDISFLATHMQVVGNIPGSLFFQKIAPKTAIMGHSMGGGASFLAAETNNPNITTKVTLAAADTNPSSISAASNVTIPSLVIAGSNDCVTPPPDHQIPKYNNLSSACKYYVNITGASHCQFNINNGTCNLGEIGCSPTISRIEQHERINNVMIPWLDYYLKGKCSAWNNFLTTLDNTSHYTHTASCSFDPAVAEIIVNGNTEFCEGDTLNVSAQTGDFTYVWSNGSENTETFVTENSDLYLVVTDVNGCKDTSETLSITVNPLPEFNVTIAPGSDPCNEDSVTLTIDNFYPEIIWNNAVTGTEFTIYGSTSISVTVTDDNGCSKTSPEETFAPLQLPAVSIIKSNDTLFSPLDANVYTWFLDDTEIEDSNSPYWIPEESGGYSLLITFEDGCEIEFPVIQILISSMSNTVNSSFEMYYFNGNIYLENKEIYPYTLQLFLYSVDGKIVKNYQINENQNMLTVEDLPGGVYFANLMSNDRIIQTLKILHP